jgi:hypothetical protein
MRLMRSLAPALGSKFAMDPSASLVVAAMGEPTAEGAVDVLAISHLVAEHFEADVVAVHVRRDGSGDAARSCAKASGVPLLIREGDVVEALAAACEELHAVGVVLAGSADSTRVEQLTRMVGADIVLQRDDGAVVVVRAATEPNVAGQSEAWSRA